jgi:hypothetical protein
LPDIEILFARILSSVLSLCQTFTAVISPSSSVTAEAEGVRAGWRLTDQLGGQVNGDTECKEAKKVRFSHLFV